MDFYRQNHEKYCRYKTNIRICSCLLALILNYYNHWKIGTEARKDFRSSKCGVMEE